MGRTLRPNEVQQVGQKNNLLVANAGKQNERKTQEKAERGDQGEGRQSVDAESARSKGVEETMDVIRQQRSERLR